MIICPHCASQQLDGTIFCVECGSSLADAGPFEPTRQLDMSGAERVEPPASGGSPPAAVESPALTLVVVAMRRRIAVDLRDEVLLGRSDLARGVRPDIDLGQFGGYDAGVSRRHAILSYRDGTYSIEDLNSANGTFVNGRRIEAEHAAMLRHGDEIMCGTLMLRVELQSDR